MSGDWLRLYRQWLDCSELHDHTARGWWATLLSRVQWREHHFRGVKIQPGELGFSFRLFAESEKVSVNTLRKWLDHFQNAGMITITTRRSNRQDVSVLKIVNWAKYQCEGVSMFDTRTDTPSDTRTDTQKKKERRKDNTKVDFSEKDTFPEFWESYPARGGKKREKAKAVAEWNRLNAEQRQQAMQAAPIYAGGEKDGYHKDAFRWLRDKSFLDWQTPPEATTGGNGPSIYRDLTPRRKQA